MKYSDCNFCDKKSIPINETIKVDGDVHCKSCFETNYTDEKLLHGKKVEQEFDSTICSSCGKDNGDIDLKKIANYPLCNDCELNIKKRTFPTWVKAFLVFIILITVFSFFWNWKYYQAYNEIKESNTHFENGDILNASKSMQKASNRVSEVKDLEVLSNFYRGYYFLTADKSQDALVEFNKCIGLVPEDYHLNSLIIQSKIGIAFDKKNYTDFLIESKNFLKIDSTKSVSLATVSSAYACLYAEKGQDSYKNQSIYYLKKALKLDSISTDAKEYRNRIEHRLYTKQIISRNDFIKKYPKGWTKN
jgi:tetratricopeptide (TPR) repeat protein